MALQLAERAEPIFAAAERLFSERGYGSVSLAEVADDLGVPEQHVYNYVGSKETLMVTCYRRGRHRLLEMLDASSSDLDDPRQFLLDGLAAIFEFARDHFEAWELLDDYASQHDGPVGVELVRSRTEFLRLLSQLIVEFRVAAGRDPGIVNTETTAAAILGIIDVVAGSWWQEHPETSAEQLALMVAPVLWGGLQAELA